MKKCLQTPFEEQIDCIVFVRFLTMLRSTNFGRGEKTRNRNGLERVSKGVIIREEPIGSEDELSHHPHPVLSSN